MQPTAYLWAAREHKWSSLLADAYNELRHSVPAKLTAPPDTCTCTAGILGGAHSHYIAVEGCGAKTTRSLMKVDGMAATVAAPAPCNSASAVAPQLSTIAGFKMCKLTPSR